MVWQSASQLNRRQAVRSGLSNTLDSARVCKYVDTIFPGRIKAISIQKGYLKIEASPENMMFARLQKGEVLRLAQKYSNQENLPFPKRIGLTEAGDSC